MEWSHVLTLQNLRRAPADNRRRNQMIKDKCREVAEKIKNCEANRRGHLDIADIVEILLAEFSDDSADDVLMLRSVGAMAIAEGDEGWQNVPIDCPMLEAVVRLRQKYDMLCDSSKPTIKELLNDDSAVNSYSINDDNCLDCGGPNTQRMSMIFAREDWLKIHPKDAGVLCANCIIRRAEKLPDIFCVQARLLPRKKLDDPNNTTSPYKLPGDAFADPFSKIKDDSQEDVRLLERAYSCINVNFGGQAYRPVANSLLRGIDAYLQKREGKDKVTL